MPDGRAVECRGEVGQDLRGTLVRKRRHPAEVRLVDRRESFVAVDRTPGGRDLRGRLLAPDPEELNDRPEQFVGVHGGLEGGWRNEPCGLVRPVLSATSPNPFIPRAHAYYRGEKQTRLGNVTSVREELAPHVHDINRALGNKVSEQEIERELSSYLNVYRVSLDTAKRSIVKKHGGNPATLAVGVSKTIRGLGPGGPSVKLLARVVAVYEKEVTPHGQGTKTILSGILGDATAPIPFTAREPLPIPFAKGDVLRVQNAYTQEEPRQGQVNFGRRTAVREEGPHSP